MIGGIQHHPDCSCLVCRLRRAEAERDALRAALKAYIDRTGPQIEFWNRDPGSPFPHPLTKALADARAALGAKDNHD